MDLPEPAQPFLDAIGRGAGDALGTLVLAEDGWIHRRVETLGVLTAEVARRQVTVDFTLPEPLRDALRIGPQWMVPLATLRKRKLRNFDLRDEAQEALPLLGREHNQLLGAAAVISQAADVVPELPAALVDELSGIVRAPDAQEGRRRLEALDAAREADAAVAAVLDHEPAWRLLAQLAENYLLLALVGDVGRRRVVKYRYDSFLSVTPGWRQSLGLDPLVVRMPTPVAAGAVSYHAEVVPPEELRSVGAKLLDADTEAVLDADPEADRVALHASAIPRDARPEVEVAIRPEQQGFPNAALGIGVVVSAVLVVGSLAGDLDRVSGGPPITVLLAASVLFAGAVGRAGEHRLVQVLFSGPRQALVLTGLSAVLAAAALGFDVPGLEWVWRFSALTSLVATLILVVFHRRCRPTIRPLE